MTQKGELKFFSISSAEIKCAWISCSGEGTFKFLIYVIFPPWDSYILTKLILIYRKIPKDVPVKHLTPIFISDIGPKSNIF